MPKNFKAFVVEERGGAFHSSIQNRSMHDLPHNDILIRVHYSSLNYKDALSASGNKGVTKQYPHTPGIDAVGEVIEASRSELFHDGDEVLVTSFDLGMNTSGGFGEYISVPEAWVVPVPASLTMRECMILGTAGLTAALSVMEIVESVTPEDGPIVITGSTGGVGSLSVAILSQLGYRVTAVSGKKQAHDYLYEIGAHDIMHRHIFSEEFDKPLASGEYAGGIDTVGGVYLENILKATKPQGVVTCCGNVAGEDFHSSLYPFIIRGVKLVGIDSQNCSMKKREKAWYRLATDWKPLQLMSLFQEIGLEQLPDMIEQMLMGKVKGRVVVKI